MFQEQIRHQEHQLLLSSAALGNITTGSLVVLHSQTRLNSEIQQPFIPFLRILLTNRVKLHNEHLGNLSKHGQVPTAVQRVWFFRN